MGASLSPGAAAPDIIEAEADMVEDIIMDEVVIAPDICAGER